MGAGELMTIAPVFGPERSGEICHQRKGERMMAKKALTKVQLNKLVVKQKSGATNVGKTVHQFLATVGEPMNYVQLLAFFDKCGAVVLGDDSKPKQGRIRRMRWGAYALEKKGFVEIIKSKDEPITVQITKSGVKALQEAA